MGAWTGYGSVPFGPATGGTTIEDLLLQKGSITMDEWIQIRAEQEYSGAESTRRIDAIDQQLLQLAIQLPDGGRDKVVVVEGAEPAIGARDAIAEQ